MQQKKSGLHRSSYLLLVVIIATTARIPTVATYAVRLRATVTACAVRQRRGIVTAVITAMATATTPSVTARTRTAAVPARIVRAVRAVRISGRSVVRRGQAHVNARLIRTAVQPITATVRRSGVVRCDRKTVSVPKSILTITHYTFILSLVFGFYSIVYNM